MLRQLCLLCGCLCLLSNDHVLLCYLLSGRRLLLLEFLHLLVVLELRLIMLLLVLVLLLSKVLLGLPLVVLQDESIGLVFQRRFLLLCSML